MKNPRGTYDLYDDDMKLVDEIVQRFFEITSIYGFNKIQTPIFEETALFKRAVGDETDVVSKEMYTFYDQKNRSLSLRPELTAPIVRSFIQNKLYVNDNNRYSYFGPAFRYERPQKGRYRQFHQLGVESFSNENYYHDVEIIIMANQFLKELGIKTKLKINTLGNILERKKYIDILKSSLDVTILCEDCQKRISTNPLRILDCKIDQENLKNIPKLSSCLTQASLTRFNEILSLLEKNNINYQITDNLVRGLDYYNDTVFEFEYTFSDGKSLALMGGGRYDHLVEQLKGPKTPAIGFGIGIERVIDAYLDQNDVSFDKEIDIYFMPMDKEAYGICFESYLKLTNAHVKCFLDKDIKSFKASFKKATSLNALYALIIGEEELKNNLVTVKNLVTKEQAQVKLKDFESDILKENNEIS